MSSELKIRHSRIITIDYSHFVVETKNFNLTKYVHSWISFIMNSNTELISITDTDYFFILSLICVVLIPCVYGKYSIEAPSLANCSSVFL